MTGETENLLYWLLRAYIARRRAGWEKGPTETEVFSRINDLLSNHGLCGHEDDCHCGNKDKTQKLLKKYDPQRWRA